MPYKKDPYAILRSKGIPLTKDQLKRLSERQAWDIIYTMKAPAKRSKAPSKPHQTVCFSGFTRQRKLELMDLAEERGWKTLQRPGVSMSHFCYGETPGPAKLDAAKKLKATLLTEEGFLTLLEHGKVAPRSGSKLMRPYLKRAAVVPERVAGATVEGPGMLEKAVEFLADPRVHQTVREFLSYLPAIMKIVENMRSTSATKPTRRRR